MRSRRRNLDPREESEAEGEMEIAKFFGYKKISKYRKNSELEKIWSKWRNLELVDNSGAGEKRDPKVKSSAKVQI